jgi:nucleoside-diphosphate-sugar epimerase
MKILINGNLGYIGPIVARHFRQKFPASRLVGYDSGFFAGCLLDPQLLPEVVLDAQLYGDVRRPVAGLYSGVNAVVQLAAISNDPMGNKFEKVTLAVNTDAVVQAARDAKAAGATHFVFASSCSVYGAGGDDAKTEDSPLNPLTAYARSKIAAEEALKPLAGPGFAITCLRFATACGLSPRLRLDLVLNDFVASALAAGKITILSDGTPWRPLIHVNDMARAIEWAATRQVANGGPFVVVNVGSDVWNYQVKELADAVRQELGNVDVSINPHAAPDKRSYRVNFARWAALAPEHQAIETLSGSVQALAAGLRAVGFKDAEFRSSNLIRLKVLSDLQSRGALDGDLAWAKA